MFAENRRRAVKGESVAESPCAGDVADDRANRRALRRAPRARRAGARCGARNWSRCRPSRPRPARAATHGRRRRCRCVRTTSETTTNGHFFSAARTKSASGRLSTGLVAMIQTALTRPSSMALNRSTALRPGLSAQARRAQKSCTSARWAAIIQLHMGGEHVGEAADLAPAHGVGLAGDRKRPAARLADAAREQMRVDDGVDLVGPRPGLVDALRIDRDASCSCAMTRS